MSRADAIDGRILAAAYALLGERGVGALTVEAVAARAGVAKTTIYRRYRNSADLATAALADSGDELEGVVLPDGLRVQLRIFLIAFATKFERVGLDVVGTMLSESADSELLELHRARVVGPHRERVSALVRAAQERGEVRADFDGALALELLVGSFFARHIGGRRLDPEQWADEALDLLWRGIAVDPG